MNPDLPLSGRHVVLGVTGSISAYKAADLCSKLRQAGAETLAEDEQSCVVFGMPKEAIARGGAKHVVTLFQMPAMLLECLDRAAAASMAR